MKFYSTATFQHIGRIVVVITMVFSNFAFAEVSTGRGEEILREAIDRDQGFGDTEMKLEMVLMNAHGESSQRQLIIQTLEVKDDGDKLMTFFERPRDVKGTALLSFTHADRDDDQWLYLPALRRVKRISSSNKSGSFMGSEFAYEDLASEEIEKFRDYKLLREETCGEYTCYVVERVPVDKESGYTRQQVWIDTTYFRFMKIDYYDRRDTLLKTRTYDDYEQYMDKYWRSLKVEMKNHQSGKSTSLLVKNIAFQVGLTDSEFDQSSLRRVR